MQADRIKPYTALREIEAQELKMSEADVRALDLSETSL